mgnify:CR=1 FL=1
MLVLDSFLKTCLNQPCNYHGFAIRTIIVLVGFVQTSIQFLQGLLEIILNDLIIANCYTTLKRTGML